jgi:hypothetical protein
LREGIAHVDSAAELHVELPPTVDAHGGAQVDQAVLRRLESGD